jgi:tetratricopeptide (TPR) repeat protein
MNKKIALFVIATATVFSSYAQNVKIVNAKNYLRDFNESKDMESLNKAKENIDLAAVHPDTKEQAKTQTLKAQVYLTIFDNSLRLETEKLLTVITDPNKRNLAAYQAASSAPLADAYAGCLASKTFDAKGNYTSEVNSYIPRIASHYENKAIADYNAKKYADALPSFEKAYEINGTKDTTTLGNCALVADRAAIYDKAKLYYQKMIDNKQGFGNTYSSLVNVYLMMKDSVVAMEILKKGRTAYPNDINLVITETNYFLKTNNSKEALSNLNIAIVAKPSDANLYLVRGNIYDNLANPKDASNKDMEKPKEYDNLMKSAETDYKKAIELKPDYFDALYNLGVLYNNHGVVLSKLADQITDNAKYKTANDLALAEFTNALPVLEKALQVSPKDRNTMYALKQIYARTQQPEKVKEINERLKNN